LTNDQKEALQKVFSTYENYVVMSDGNNSMSYAKDVINAVKELAIVFPAVSLKNDKLGLFKNIYFMKTTVNKHRALLDNCVDNDKAILHKREIEGVKK